MSVSSCVLAGDVKAMAAGYGHSMVLNKDNTVWVTGWNRYGQLGDGSYNNKNKFEQVVGTWDTALGNTLSTRTTLSVRLQQTVALDR